MMYSSTAITGLALALTPLSFAAPTATVDNGVLSGVSTSVPGGARPVSKFLGIPYAQKAVRFEPPKAAGQSGDEIDCTEYKDTCIQLFGGSDEQSNFIQELLNEGAPQESEDCLYLNVFAPSDSGVGATPSYNSTSAGSSSGKAVLFWIYGGGFQFGSSTLPSYDGSQLAANEDVIVVTHNYRMNVFGFPGSPELADGENNLGLLDQRMALQWVRDNMATFGGDPEKITIFGESAGGFAVDTMVLSMPDPPFRAAILQSGQATDFPASTKELAAIGWRSFMAAVGCDDLACVKNVDTEALVAAMKNGSASFQPMQDDVTVVTNPTERRNNGEFAQVPVLTGSNANELRLLFGAQNQTSDDGEAGLGSSIGGPFTGGDGALAGGPAGLPEMPSLEEILKARAAVKEAFADLRAINKAYPLGTALYPNLQYQVAAILTDVAFTCPQGRQANASIGADIPTWRYYYNATTPNTAFSPEAGAYHAQEIPQVFGTYPSEGATDQQIALSKTMSKAWADFAKNPSQGPGWDGFGTGSVGVLGDIGNEKGTGVTVVGAEVIDGNCRLLEQIQQKVADQGAAELAQRVAGEL